MLKIYTLLSLNNRARRWWNKRNLHLNNTFIVVFSFVWVCVCVCYMPLDGRTSLSQFQQWKKNCLFASQRLRTCVLVLKYSSFHWFVSSCPGVGGKWKAESVEEVLADEARGSISLCWLLSFFFRLNILSSGSSQPTCLWAFFPTSRSSRNDQSMISQIGSSQQSSILTFNWSWASLYRCEVLGTQLSIQMR